MGKTSQEGDKTPKKTPLTTLEMVRCHLARPNHILAEELAIRPLNYGYKPNQMPGGFFKADLIVVVCEADAKITIREIEIKSSKADYIKDFQKGKHEAYREKKRNDAIFTPDALTYATDDLELAEYMGDDLRARKLPYGVIHVREGENVVSGKAIKNTRRMIPKDYYDPGGSEYTERINTLNMFLLRVSRRLYHWGLEKAWNLGKADE